MNKFCPTCIIELQEEKRKLGRGSKKWLVCPSCGFRMKLNDPQPDSHLINELNRTNTLEDEENNDYRQSSENIEYRVVHKENLI